MQPLQRCKYDTSDKNSCRCTMKKLCGRILPDKLGRIILHALCQGAKPMDIRRFQQIAFNIFHAVHVIRNPSKINLRQLSGTIT